MENTRNVLVRQSRDLLICSYNGDLNVFEKSFMRPAADIVEKCYEKYLTQTVSHFQFHIYLYI